MNHVLRPGDVGTATGIKPFLHHTLDLLGRAGLKNGRVRARLDSGFESDEVMGVLERRRVGYVVKMRATSDVARFYDKRADVERTICELKNDLAIANIPSASFAANAADLWTMDRS